LSKSTFHTDLEKEKKLGLFLNTLYKKHLKYYTFERISDRKKQHEGIDLIFTHKKSGAQFTVDEKAQLDYLNESLPTFAFELCYYKKDVLKKGWFFDTAKKTQFYALVTSIYNEDHNFFTSCDIYFVNREKLLTLLKNKNIDYSILEKIMAQDNEISGKLDLPQLKPQDEGYLYFTKNKAEKPINLILRLTYLLKTGVAKKLV
jgi:hypothetical protein